MVKCPQIQEIERSTKSSNPCNQAREVPRDQVRESNRTAFIRASEVKEEYETCLNRGTEVKEAKNSCLHPCSQDLHVENESQKKLQVAEVKPELLGLKESIHEEQHASDGKNMSQRCKREVSVIGVLTSKENDSHAEQRFEIGEEAGEFKTLNSQKYSQELHFPSKHQSFDCSNNKSFLTARPAQNAESFSTCQGEQPDDEADVQEENSQLETKSECLQEPPLAIVSHTTFLTPIHAQSELEGINTHRATLSRLDHENSRTWREFTQLSEYERDILFDEPYANPMEVTIKSYCGRIWSRLRKEAQGMCKNRSAHRRQDQNEQNRVWKPGLC